ncbi:unnamed protein product, partial [Meganyctiphanes norvegica]
MSGGTSCIVCFEQFQESRGTAPVMLSCGHSFCRECLSIMSSPINCPICRSPHTGPHPAQLPTNYGLLGLTNYIVGKLRDGLHGTMSLSSSPVATPYGTPSENTPLLACQSQPVTATTLPEHLMDQGPIVSEMDLLYNMDIYPVNPVSLVPSYPVSLMPSGVRQLASVRQRPEQDLTQNIL